MHITNRYLYEKILSDLGRKMVFLGGPRQVGKSTLAQHLINRCETEKKNSGALLNWDYDEDRTRILGKDFPITQGLLVFDELHKNRKWRNYLKGLFDKRKKDFQILVTGSARLDLYRFGGDSLQGRYFFHRLHPFSVRELNLTTQKEIETLMLLSGFPEPYFLKDQTEKLRWSNSYRTRLIREDLRDLEQVIDLSTIELLSQRLPALVGSPLSINALREDLQVAHATLENWISILERLYFIYRVYPFGPPKVRAIKKLSKHYHFDWSLPLEPGAKFENLIAGHLLKWCNYQEDVFGKQLELRYYRDSEGREVDFVIVEQDKPLLLIEVKLSTKQNSKGLKYLKSKYPNARAIQISLEDQDRSMSGEGIERTSASQFLNELV